MKEKKEEVVINVQCYTTTELAPLLNRSPRAFRRELALLKHRYGPRPGRRWSIDQLRMILDDFGCRYRIVLLDEAA